MRLPNKVTPYSKSAIAWFPTILNRLREDERSPQALLEALVKDKANMGDFLDALDCLYALGRIKFTEEGSLLHYVETD